MVTLKNITLHNGAIRTASATRHTVPCYHAAPFGCGGTVDLSARALYLDAGIVRDSDGDEQYGPFECDACESSYFAAEASDLAGVETGEGSEMANDRLVEVTS